MGGADLLSAAEDAESPSIAGAEPSKGTSGAASIRKHKRDDAQQASSKTKTMYLCHPKEKFACAILVGIIVIVRSFSFWKGLLVPPVAPLGSEGIEDTFKHAADMSDVNDAVNFFCRKDLDILCRREDRESACTSAFGPLLAGLLWGENSHPSCDVEPNDDFVWDMLSVKDEDRTKLKESLEYRIPLNFRSDDSLQFHSKYTKYDDTAHFVDHESQRKKDSPMINNPARLSERALPFQGNDISDYATHWLSYMFVLSFQKIRDRIAIIHGYKPRKIYTNRVWEPADRMIGLYIRILVHHFAKDRKYGTHISFSDATAKSVTTRVWIPEDLFLVMRWAVRFCDRHRDMFQPAEPELYDDFISRSMMVINQTQRAFGPGQYWTISSSSELEHRCRFKYAFRHPTTNEMAYHYSSAMAMTSVVSITSSCQNATAAALMRRRSFGEEQEFEPFEHTFAFVPFIAFFIRLLMLYGAKKRRFKKLESARRRLRLELEDPFLRRTLERKVEMNLSEQEREPFLTKLSRISQTPPAKGVDDGAESSATWNSERLASKRIHRDVRRFRIHILLFLVFASILYTCLMVGGIRAWDRYLEIVLLSLLFFGAPYVIEFDGAVGPPATEG